ncbi:PIR protein [Plasmodium vivax]|nr:PIR protein [Plasmodium vivax]
MSGSGGLEELIVIFIYFEKQLAIESMGLPSSNFYKNLNHDYKDIDKYYDDCNSLLSHDKGNRIKIPCAQLVKYLKTKSRTLGDESYTYDDCILLNYWIYGKLFNTYNSTYSSEFFQAWGRIHLLWNDIVQKLSKNSQYKICKPDNSMVSQPYWQKRKELYDYYVDFDHLQKTANRFGKCEDYYKYIKSKAELYEHFEKQCYPYRTSMCPDFYETCKLYKPDNVLHTLNCHNRILEEELQKKESLQASSAEADEVSEPGVIVPDISASSETAASSTHIVTKAGNTLLVVIVTSMTSGALYRFTPLGSMLRNGLGRNNNMRNLNIGNNGLFDYESELFNPYTGGGEEHYIGYQPA